jgi:hypothetical protein
MAAEAPDLVDLRKEADMRRPNSTVLIIALVALLIPSSFLWYRGHYSMKAARSFEAGARSAAQRVLIATQGSPYKDALVDGIVRNLASRGVYIRVIDVSKLPDVKPDDWAAIVLIHTWEYSKPQADAKAFIDRLADRHRVITVTTSGSGRERMPGVDAISSASLVAEPPTPLPAVTRRLDALLSEPAH